jgi:hypothetical protein
LSKNRIPDLVLALANSRKAKRPSGSRVRVIGDPLSDAKAAAAFLGSLVLPRPAGFPVAPVPVDEKVLTEVRDLRAAIEEILAGVPTPNQEGCTSPDIFHRLAGPIGVLNRLSSDCPWVKTLGPGPRIAEIPVQPDLAGLLAAMCIEELAGCDLTRSEDSPS